ncbi:hypothetical protein EIP86_003302 [Pleurotus ostreatoroseus]|nr:hypothetical protein EIP86_003302 [Pleurotus ostreatoroseus]
MRGISEENEATVRTTLEQLKPEGGEQDGQNHDRKVEMKVKHKFWGTQPVTQLGEEPPLTEGCIEPSKPASEVRQEPYPLRKEFEWSTVDVCDDAQLRELYEFLSANYVEDDDASFRFRYSAEFLRWALKPPGYYKEWHVGVRVVATKKLVAFVSGVPLTVRVRENVLSASEVNFLCVHKKLRSKRLAPVLIKEVTRRCHLKGVFQALHTGGVFIPTPVSTCSLNVPKLVSVGFTSVPTNMTLARMMRQHLLPSRPHLLSQGLREMEERDVPEVADLYARYMKRFGMAIIMTEDEVRHHFLSGRGEGPNSIDSWKTPRAGQCVWTYVMEDPHTHKVTDFFSFFSLPSSIIDSPKHDVLKVAYLFYYATEVVFKPGAETDGSLKERLMQLVSDALIIADQSGFDVFNALTLMDNAEFIPDLKDGAIIRNDGYRGRSCWEGNWCRVGLIYYEYITVSALAGNGLEVCLDSREGGRRLQENWVSKELSKWRETKAGPWSGQDPLQPPGTCDRLSRAARAGRCNAKKNEPDPS